MSMKINHELPLPEVLKSQYPLSQELKEVKKQRDEEIRRIFTGESDKFIVLVGPCSADNEDTVCEYVRRLKIVADKVSDKLMIIPRVYTNKPRTTGDGYKGMLHQPDPDKSPDLLAGIIAIRKLHMRVMQETGLSSADRAPIPLKTAVNSPFLPKYLTLASSSCFASSAFAIAVSASCLIFSICSFIY